MVKTGDVIENPMTGERMVFVETAADSGGERLRIDLHLAPRAHNAGSHRHAKQSERLEIVRGELQIVVGDAPPRKVRQGDVVDLAPGVPHVWWNDSGAEAQVAIEYRPARNTEDFFTSFFALGRDGRTTKTGAPHFLQLVLMAPYFEIWDGRAPMWLQRAVSWLLSPLARLLGHRPEYVSRAERARLTAAPTC